MRTPITYYGGKQMMLKHILPLIPPHNIYVEAFCGGAAVLFAKDACKAEIINDVNAELINFYRVAQSDYHALSAEINNTLHSRDLHAHAAYIYTHPDLFTAVQRAWAVWCLCKMSYASKLEQSFGYDFCGRSPRRVQNAKDYFTEDICRRLECVTIENEDALNVIYRYDTDKTFHFIDPPYVNTACGHYRNTFKPEDLIKLLDCLTTIKGRFMLTTYPSDVVKKYIDTNGWTCYKVKRSINASKETRRLHEEWIVCNY